jgi:putative transposase
MPTVTCAYRYRWYPTPQQAEELARTFGCVRLVYNRALEARTVAWEQERRRISYAETSALLTEWKQSQELGFLREVSSVPLQQSLRHLNAAFVAFRAGRARHPRFKAKKRRWDTAEYTRSAFRYRNGHLSLAKLPGSLAIRWSRQLPEGAQPSTVTVSRDPSGRWFVSLRIQRSVAHLPSSSSRVGVDVGLTSLVTLSTGEQIANPRHERRDRNRLTRAQRNLSRRQKGSANREKARRRVARVHTRITDRRRDHLHKLTTRLVRDNQTVVIEDLCVRGMAKNHLLARAISDASWAELRRQLTYKTAWYGRQLIVIDRFAPSSKTCSTCGRVRPILSLGLRVWSCVDCGVTHDRDINAARNILAAGLAAAACGAGGRPHRESSRLGQLAMKQEPRRVTAGLPAL